MNLKSLEYCDARWNLKGEELLDFYLRCIGENYCVFHESGDASDLWTFQEDLLTIYLDLHASIIRNNFEADEIHDKAYDLMFKIRDCIENITHDMYHKCYLDYDYLDCYFEMDINDFIKGGGEE
jgi:hypothetical protein